MAIEVIGSITLNSNVGTDAMNKELFGHNAKGLRIEKRLLDEVTGTN